MIGIRMLSVVLLLHGASAFADIFTVGPSGTYGSIQPAVNAAIAIGSDFQEVRVESGVYLEHVNIAIAGNVNVTLSGGWNSSFSSQTLNPALTEINGSDTDTVLFVKLIDTCRLNVRNLSLVNGKSMDQGGGLHAQLSDNARLDMSSCDVHHNSSAVSGAGLMLSVSQLASFIMAQSSVRQNQAFGSDGRTGMGMKLVLTNSAFADIRETLISQNENIAVLPFGDGGGLTAFLNDFATLNLLSMEFAGNVLRTRSGSGSAASLDMGGSTRANVLQLNVHDNVIESATSGEFAQVQFLTFADSELQFANSLVHSGNYRGVDIGGSTAGAIQVSNVTIADHPELGLYWASLGGTRRLSNSIIHGNFGASQGVNLASGIQVQNSAGDDLGASNPLFVNAPLDYHLQSTSPARNSGNNLNTIGASDLEGRSRVLEGTVDLGAYEFPTDAIYFDGFDGIL